MIFFDNASTTKCTKESVEIVTKYLTENYYNPSALYHNALSVKQDLERARQTIIKKLRGEGKIIFTGGGTESDNIALLGSKKIKGGRVIVSSAEHAAIYATANELKARGYEVVFAPVDANGKVIEEEFIKLLTPSVTLVSILHVNNETGAINDIQRLCKLVKSKCPRALFHSDGVQAFGKIEVNLRGAGIDLYSMSAHKIGAPKGVGALYVRNKNILKPIFYGGGQEYNIRSGTENVPAIMAFAKAVEEFGNIKENYSKVQECANAFKEQLTNDVKINSYHSPYILSFSFKGVNGETLVHMMESEGILISRGSACSSKKSGNRILENMGLSHEEILGSVRVSFSKHTTLEEARFAGKKLNDCYIKLKETLR